MRLKIITALTVLFFIAFLPTKSISQIKQVLYINQNGVDPGDDASSPSNDPVIRMLNSDDNFEVNYIVTNQDGSSIPDDLSGFDLIIVQENMSSGAELFMPDGKLGIKNVPVPIIYNKASAFRDGRAVTDQNAYAISTQNLFITVPEANQDNDLFSGIDFSGNEQIRITYNLTNSSGADPGDRAIEIVNDLDISTPGTLLATVPEVTDTDKALVVNYLPAGTQLGEASTDVLNVNAVALSFGYGPLVYQNGTNITNEALTIWRNAAYSLTGLTVPEELYYNPSLSKKILYVNQTGVDPGSGGGAVPGYDPLLRMLQFEDYFEVTYVETPPDGSGVPALSDFDLVIAQETISSGAEMFKPGGILGIKDVTIPIIYNKTYAFREGLAVTDADAAVTSTQNLSITVNPDNQTNPLFNGIDFSGGSDIMIFNSTAGNDGSEIGDKSIDILNNLDISISGTLLASVPEVTSTDQAMVVNYFPTGTQLGTETTDVLQVDAIALCFSYGALAKENGANITNQGLTIWRNAAYMLTGLPVPTELTNNPAFLKQVLYLNQRGVGSNDGDIPDVEGNSSPNNDPVIRMLNADGNFKVTYRSTYSDGEQIPDPQLYDLVIAQETLSSGAAFFQPGGALAVNTIKTPIIYNKTATFRDGRAITDADVELVETQNLSITVPVTNQSHGLFSGIDFSAGDQIRITNELTNPEGGADGNKALDILNNIDISTPGTLLAMVPEVTDTENAFVVNYLPAETQLGEAETDVLAEDAVALSFSYGGLIKGDGENVSSEALTIWRNAAYMLTGLTVPNELYINPNYIPLSTDDNILEVSNVVLSPNPTNGFVNLKISGVNQKTSISLYNITGRRLWFKEINIKGEQHIPFDLSQHAQGMYFLRVEAGLIDKTIKVLKR